MSFTVFEKKSCFTLACDSQHQPPLVNYTPTTRLYIGSPKFNVSDTRRWLFSDFLRARNMVRVIEGKII